MTKTGRTHAGQKRAARGIDSGSGHSCQHELELLRESEERFRKIFESNPVGMALVGLDFRFIHANLAFCQLLLYSLDELTRLTLLDVTDPGDMNKELAFAGKLAKSEIPFYHANERWLKKNSEPLWVGLTTTLIPRKRGDSPCFFLITEDVTERVQNERKMVKQRRRLLMAVEDLRVINKIAGAASRTIEINELLQTALATITELEVFNVWRQGGIMILAGQQLIPAAFLNLPDTFLEAHRHLGASDCLCGEAATSGRIVYCSSAFDDGQHCIRYEGMKNHADVIVPLKTSARIVGVMFLHLSAGAFMDRRRRRLLSIVGSLLANAVANAQHYQQAKHKSLHDPLTGLANRNLMDVELARNFARNKRAGEPFSVIMIDLDHFKDFNDVHGHSCGDRVLVDIAQLISGEIREVDLGVRYGGEEFLLILPGTGRTEAIEVAERIRRKIAGFNLNTAPRPAHITVSLGVADCDKGVADARTLIARADSSLYRAKEKGRNKVETWLELPAA